MRYLKRGVLIGMLFIFASYNSFAQNETVANDSVVIIKDTLLRDSIQKEETIDLLPDKYLPTQSLLWGKKGLMRNFKRFELTRENRDFEQDIRETMFKAHRYIGFATLAGMIAQGIVGERLYKGHTDLKDLHSGLAGVVNVGYFTTAGLALFAPPRFKNGARGFNTYKLHKYLAIVHLSSMIATNILSGLVEDNPGLKPYHRATAYMAYSSFFVSMVVIQF